MAGRQKQTLLADWNATSREYAEPSCVHELFEAQAKRTPQAVAVVCRDQSVTYAELNRRADRVARRLDALGVGPGCLVGVCVHRSVGLVAALLGALKAGAAYVPLDPSYPRERLGFMLEDARVSAVLTARDLAPALPPHGADVVVLDAQGEPEGCAAPAGVNAAARPEDVAYVLFTSGSSGRPKGVAVRHRNVVNFFAGMDDLLEFKEPGTWLAVTSTSFDISVLELFWTLRAASRWSSRKRPSAPSRPPGPCAAEGWTSACSISPRTPGTAAATSTACSWRAPASPTKTASPPCGRRSGTSTPSAASIRTRP